MMTRKTVALGALAALIITLAGCESGVHAAPAAEAAVQDAAGGQETIAKATFAAGCFWGVEAAFRQLEGVVSTTVGYTGGSKEDPSYREVCAGKTGHAEAVEVVYDPAKLSYEALLDVFWATHDPTTPNRQGPDVGTQYRSAIFYHSREQAEAARMSKERLAASGQYRGAIVTEIVPASAFYRAEEYHQRYLEKRGIATCHT